MMYQVGLSSGGSHLVSEFVAKIVSIKHGGSGDVELIDSCRTYNLYMIDLPDPVDGAVDVIDENGEIQHVKVETPMP